MGLTLALNKHEEIVLRTADGDVVLRRVSSPDRGGFVLNIEAPLSIDIQRRNRVK